jgi:sulfate/thiosulfate transport system substrate-binding protein
MLTNNVSFVKATLGVLRVVVLPPLLLVVVVAAAACGGSSAQAEGDGSEGGGNGGTLSLVAYSTPREVYEELIPLFQETDAGQGFEFEQSYASSGEQSRAVEAGLPADVVAFSLEPDVTRLVDASTRAWSPTPWSSSPCARATRRASEHGTTC